MRTSEIIQALEARRLFAIPVVGGVATINGTANADVLEVVVNGGILQVRNAAGSVLDSVAYAGVSRIVVNGGSGSDFIRLGRANGSLVPGIRTILAGNNGNDTIIGGLGPDQVVGGVGDDRLDGRAGADLIDGGDGFDTVDYGYRTVPVQVTLTNAPVGNDGSTTGNSASIATANDAGGDNVANVEAAIGGTGADVITGNSGANWIDGGGGNDSLYGGAGIDTIVGGVHNDLAYGEGDDDTFLMKDSAADKFLGTPGTTFAQYDTTLDSPAPSVAATLAASASLKAFGASLAAVSGVELTPDTTFGIDHDGKQVISSGAGSLFIQDVILQPDGKIVAVGSVSYSSEAPSDFVVMRFEANGTLDTDFGADETGIVFTDFTPSGSESEETGDFAKSVTIDSLNRIVVAGSATYATSFDGESTTYISNFAVARYLSDGTLDPDFGDGGTVTIDPNEITSYDTGARIVTQQVSVEGSFVDHYLVAGTVGPYNGPSSFLTERVSLTSTDFAMLRLDDFGVIDTSFGDGDLSGLAGLVQEDFGNSDVPTQDYLSGLNTDEEGNIWLSGDAAYPESDSDFAVVGYDAGGANLDYGKDTYSFDRNASAADATIIGSNLIVVGSLPSDGAGPAAILATSIEPPVTSDFTVSALVAGDFVTSIVDEPDTTYLSFSSVTVDENGNAVAVGTADGDFYVYRFNPEDLTVVGTPLTFDFGESFDEGRAVAVQHPDGKYLVVGQTGSAVGMLRLQEAAETWVDVNLNSGDVQSTGFFTYIDANGAKKPVPTYLVWRYTKLDDDGTWTIEGTDIGETYDVYQKNGIVTVTRDGEFWQETAGTVKKIIINAGGGNDTVNVASGFTLPVRVNAGAGNDTVRGGNGADDLYGEDGNDVLVGFGGNDTVRGGKGRDILFGGDGRDSLIGESGEDVLVAGITKYDSSVNLQKLADEWNRTDLDYKARVKHLINGGGKNGTIVLNKTTAFSLRSVADILLGGSDLDAFWGSFRVPGDVITDRIAAEIIESAS